MDFSTSSLQILSQRPAAQVVVKSDIFAPAGSPVHVWIETTAVPSHPRLFRRLKSNGACVVHDPRDATLIIVNGSSLAGRKFVRDWCNDVSKVCLDFAWVQRSLDAGKALLEPEEFGHCRLFDDGTSISEDDEESDPIKLHNLLPPSTQLPTPRPTPTTSIPTAKISTSSPPHFSISQLSSPTSASSTVNPPPQPQPMPPQFWPQIGSPSSPYAVISGVVPFGGQFTPSNSQIPVPSFLSDPNYMAMLDWLYRQQHRQQHNSQSQQHSQPYQQLIQQTYQQSLQLQSLPQPQQVPQQLQPSQPSHSTTPQTSSHPQASFPNSAIIDPTSHNIPPTSQPLTIYEDSPLIIEQGSENWSTTSRVAPPPDRTEPAMFEAELGVPLKFLVQIQIKNRNQITKAIKRHGGKIIFAVGDADFAILNSRGSDYDTLRKQADFNDVPVLNPSFVTDCDVQGTFLNTADYIIVATESPRGKKRKSVDGLSTNLPSKARKTKGNPYTPEEKEYFTNYVRRLLKKTPDTTLPTLASLLNKKMPTHSTDSWLWFCRKNKEEVEGIRRKVDKGERRKMDLQPSQIEQKGQLAEPSSEMPPSTPRMPKAEPYEEVLPLGDAAAQDEQEDFDFVREFFASGAGDSGSEDEVWETMAARRTCKSAQTWKKFCNANYERIAQEQQTLLGNAGS